MPRPVTDPNTMIRMAVEGFAETFLSEPENFTRIADAAGFEPQGAGGVSEIVTVDKSNIEIGRVENPHPLTKLAIALSLRSALYLYGPKGSGKSTLARSLAKARGLSCTVQGRVDGVHELFGFENATGNYRPTAFRRVFGTGGVFCLDEIDRSDPSAITALNDAIASREAVFPDGNRVEAHPDFVFVGTGNTTMRGDADGYVSAVEQDAAIRDRLAFIHVDYNEDFERTLVPVTFRDWVERVFALRAAAAKIGADIDATPRATITGAQLLSDGLEQDAVENALIWRGVDAATRSDVLNAMEE